MLSLIKEKFSDTDRVPDGFFGLFMGMDESLYIKDSKQNISKLSGGSQISYAIPEITYGIYTHSSIINRNLVKSGTLISNFVQRADSGGLINDINNGDGIFSGLLNGSSGHGIANVGAVLLYGKNFREIGYNFDIQISDAINFSNVLYQGSVGSLGIAAVSIFFDNDIPEEGDIWVRSRNKFFEDQTWSEPFLLTRFSFGNGSSGSGGNGSGTESFSVNYITSDFTFANRRKYSFQATGLANPMDYSINFYYYDGANWIFYYGATVIEGENIINVNDPTFSPSLLKFELKLNTTVVGASYLPTFDFSPQYVSMNYTPGSNPDKMNFTVTIGNKNGYNDPTQYDFRLYIADPNQESVFFPFKKAMVLTIADHYDFVDIFSPGTGDYNFIPAVISNLNPIPTWGMPYAQTISTTSVNSIIGFTSDINVANDQLYTVNFNANFNGHNYRVYVMVHDWSSDSWYYLTITDFLGDGAQTVTGIPILDTHDSIIIQALDLDDLFAPPIFSVPSNFDVRYHTPFDDANFATFQDNGNGTSNYTVNVSGTMGVNNPADAAIILEWFDGLFWTPFVTVGVTPNASSINFNNVANPNPGLLTSVRIKMRINIGMSSYAFPNSSPIGFIMS